MKTPTTLLQTRQALGMSQQAFARLLHISRSQLAMAETGRRLLPAAASTLLLQIQQEMDREDSSRLLETALRQAQGDNSLQTQADISGAAAGQGHNSVALPKVSLDPRLANLAGRCRQDAIRCRKMARQLQKKQLIEARRRQVDPLMARLAEERSLPHLSPSTQRRQQPQNNRLPNHSLPARLLEAARHFDAIADLLEH